MIDRKRYLLDGMAQLVSADYVAWVLAAATDPGKKPVYVGFETRGISAEQMPKFLRIQAHPALAEYSQPLLVELSATGQQVTANVQDIFDYAEFESSEWGKMWADADIAPRCIIHRPLANGGVSGIGCYRRLGRPLFTECERLIVHLLLTEIPWLHEMGWPGDLGAKVPDLPPQGWLVHEMLLQGFDRSRIAAELGISRHTSDSYVKQVFRHLGVQSQPELMARFFLGG
ncbi:MAG: helix-turn-helix transcriptional regulator [Chthoniobacterales bacterium]